MKKKGFTLIELLAVIVILAIIALIAIPLIGNVIEKAKIGAIENSVNGLVESANMYYANQSIKGEQATETIFDFANGEQTSTEKLEYKGKVYNGKLILHANGEVAVCIDDKEHYAYKNKNNDEVISGVGTCLYDGTTGDFSSNSPLEDLKKQISQVTATASDVVEGKIILTADGLVTGTHVGTSGTLTYNGFLLAGVTSSSIGSYSVYIVPKGYTSASITFGNASRSGTQTSSLQGYNGSSWVTLYSTSSTGSKNDIDISSYTQIRVNLSGTANMAGNEWNHILYTLTID